MPDGIQLIDRSEDENVYRYTRDDNFKFLFKISNYQGTKFLSYWKNNDWVILFKRKTDNENYIVKLAVSTFNTIEPSYVRI